MNKYFTKAGWVYLIAQWVATAVLWHIADPSSGWKRLLFLVSCVVLNFSSYIQGRYAESHGL